jgi:hypothetical protein
MMRKVGMALMLGLALGGCGKEKPAVQAGVERGFEAIQQAKGLQQQSQKWKAPTGEEAEAAIRAFEGRRGPIRTFAIGKVTPQDQYDKYVAKATVNGTEQTYNLERNPAGAWVASAAGTD